MESNSAGFAAFIPLLTMMIPLIFICRRLSKDKGRNATKYTILGCIPFVNYFALLYLVGTTNTILEDKLDQVLSIINSDKFSEKKTGKI
jgi:hypothetical protein